jgi:fatty acid CoA ligase FadD21
MMQPSYGLAEATVYMVSRAEGGSPHVVHFEPEQLSEGNAQRCPAQTGSPLLSYGTPTSPTVRIVDPDTGTQCPAGTVGEIWVSGENVADLVLAAPGSIPTTTSGKIGRAACVEQYRRRQFTRLDT